MSKLVKKTYTKCPTFCTSMLKIGEMMQISDKTEPGFNGEVIIKLHDESYLCLDDLKIFPKNTFLNGRKFLRGESIELFQE